MNRLTRGELLGRYVVQDLIGEGGIGEVYAAYDPELDRKVALKRLKRVVGGAWEARLKREAQALAKLSHPNVVPVFDVGVVGGRLFLAMELVPGMTLRAWSRQTRTRREVFEVFRSAGEGLAAAHRAGLVHRDFKPDNVLIGEDGRVRVLDFGIAKLDATEDPPQAEEAASPGASEAVLTAAGTRMGTPQYMAPEQHRGMPADARADQFAFCVSLYEVLYGERPFDGDAGSAWLAITKGTVRPPPASSRVPLWLRRVLLRGLSLEVSDRYPTMDALLAALANDPARRAGLLALTAGLSIATLAAGAAMWERSTRTRRACEAEVRALDTLITPGARAAAQAGLLATGVGYAPEAWARFQSGLDVRLATLREEQRALCSQALAQGERTPALKARAECLAQRRLELRSTLETFAGATWLDVSYAGRALDELPPAQACREERVEDGATDDQRAAVARARALGLLGHFEQALSLLVQARASSSPALRAEARLIEASSTMELGRFAQSDAALVDALVDGASANRGALVAEAWSERVRLASVWRGHPQDAAEYARHARAELERLGGAPELEARLDLRLAAALHEASDAAGAVTAATSAVKSLEQLRGPDDLLVALALNQQGNSQRLLGKFDEALAAHERALRIRRQALPAGHPLLAQSLNGVGSARLGKGDAAGALQAHEEAVKLLEGTPGNPLDLAKALTGRALDRTQLGDRPGATADLERALELIARSEQTTHPLVVDLEAHLGDVLAADGNWEPALAAHRRAVVRARDGEPKPKLGALLLREARDLISLDRKSEALERLDEAAPLVAADAEDSESARALREEARH